MNFPDLMTSRFIRQDDPHSADFVFPLPAHWWSRHHEYPWAAQFASAEDVVLDAACGMCHPLKFYLADHCREVHACDMDPRTLDVTAIRQEIREQYGEQADRDFPQSYFMRIKWQRTPLEKLPYPDAMFDKVYCISVLEHLPDAFNERFWLYPLYGLLHKRTQHLLMDALMEFRRVLKTNGKIILTFDFPRINLGYLQAAVKRAGLQFAGPVALDRPADALYGAKEDLYCVRTVLCHAST